MKAKHADTEGKYSMDGQDMSAKPMSPVDALLVSPDLPASRALRQMDAGGEKILFVVGDDRVIQGVVTDGDVRRWIISGRGLDEPVGALMNTRPVALTEPCDPDAARALFLQHRIDSIPVLDAARRVVAVVRSLDLLETEQEIHGTVRCPVVIMAGGEGTRLAPFTRVLPKPLVPVGTKPIIEHIIRQFTRFGCSDFYLTLNYKANLIKAFFADTEHDFSLTYVEETRPLGTAGGLSLLRDSLTSTFFLSNCDILVDVDLADFYAFHAEHGNRVSLVGSTKHFVIPYGVCQSSAGGVLTRVDEKPEFNFLVSTGLYLVEPDVLEDVPTDAFFNFTDLMNLYIERGERIGVYPVSEGSWMDMGQWDTPREMPERFADR
jgi:dTDP-glucose pyrophosphorylase/CBS domain-containing protein